MAEEAKAASSGLTVIDDILEIQVPKTIEISPNAQQVLYSTSYSLDHKKGDHDTTTIWLADTGHPSSSRQLTSGRYNDSSPIWNPDGNSIAFISDREKAGEQWAIYILPLRVGGEAYPITPVENERSIHCYDFSPDGKFIAYASADEKTPEKKAKEKEKDDAKVWGEDWPYNRLRILHVATKKVTTLVSHDAHVVDFEWSPDGSKLAVAEVRDPDIESKYTDGTKLSIIDVSSKKTQQLCVFPNSIDCLVWATEDKLHFTSAYKPDSVVSAETVYCIDLTATKLQYVRVAHGEEDCAMGLVKAGKDVAVQVQRGMEDQIVMLESRVIFSRKREIGSWDAQFTSDSEEMIIAVSLSTSSSPGEVYTITASGGALVKLSNHGHAVEGQYFGAANFLRCRSDDDREDIDGLFVSPSKEAGKPEKPLPTVVLPHGGPYTRITDSFNPSYYYWSNLLVNAGYGVLFPNYRGSSGRGEKFAAYARGATGTVDYDDVITLTQYAIEQGYADKESLIVGGWSQGGFLSFICCTRNGLHGKGWKFKGAIPGAGVSDGDTMTLTSDIGAFQEDLAGLAPWKSDKSDTSGRTGSALWEFKDAVEKDILPPMLILHGEEDDRVPVEQAVGFRRALDSVDASYEMVLYPREPHAFKERKHLIDMAERVLRFVDVHIGRGK